jgi:uncharacterized membrane protein YkoI
MRYDRMLISVTAAGVLGAVSIVAGAAQNKDRALTLEQLPAPVRATILQETGDGTIKEIMRETEGGKTLYEAEWIAGGRTCEIEVTSDGALMEREEEVDAADVPDAVKSVAARRFPAGARVVYVKKMIVLYELEAEIDGKETEILVAPTGRVYEDDEEEDSDADD